MATSFVFDEDTRFPFSPQTLGPLIIQLITSAYAPISGRPVVALGRGSEGRLFAGVNVELPGLPLHASIHAEQFLVANLSIHTYASKLNFLAISSNGSYFHAPCVDCCQFLQEIRHASDTQVLMTLITGEVRYMHLSTFFRPGFSPHNGIPMYVPGLLDPTRDNMLTLVDQNVDRYINDRFDRDSILKRRALSAANLSYAPYSNCPSGVALMDRNGEIYTGWYIESETQSPSLGPVKVALVDFVMANKGSHEFEKIVQAVLVEKINPVVNQEADARMILGTIAHDCVVNVLHCSLPAMSSD